MDEQKTQPIAVPASPAQTGQQTTADTQPLPQHSQQSQYTQQSQYPQYGEPQYQNAQYQPASYSPQPQQNAPAPVPAKRRHWSIIIAVIAAITIVASLVGAYVYHSRHEQALSDCRNAVSEFTKVRKELLDTGGSSSQIQQLLRNMLGVSDILDAAADASSSAEQTVRAEGCAANATITQLNLVKDTVASATDSLRTSVETRRRRLLVTARRRRRILHRQKGHRQRKYRRRNRQRTGTEQEGAAKHHRFRTHTARPIGKQRTEQYPQTAGEQRVEHRTESRAESCQ